MTVYDFSKENSLTIVLASINYRWLSSENDDGIYGYAELVDEHR